MERTMSLAGLDERLLYGDSRVAEWSMGGAMFGLTAAVVQMLIRSLIVKRNNLNRRVGSRRMDRRKQVSQRKSEENKKSKSFRAILNHHHSPLMVDETGGVVTHVFTYPYVIPVYYNYGKYDLNSLNKDYFETTTSTTTTTSSTTTEGGSPWDRIDDIELPDTLHENMHSVFSLRNYKQYITEKDPTVREQQTHDDDYEDKDFIERTNAYLTAYFKHAN